MHKYMHKVHTSNHHYCVPLDRRVPKRSSLSRKHLVDPAGAASSADNGSDTRRGSRSRGTETVRTDTLVRCTGCTGIAGGWWYFFLSSAAEP